MNLRDTLRKIPDFPKLGILFIDVTTLFKDGKAFQVAIDELAQKFAGEKIDLIVSPEARGFAVGAPLAYLLGAGFVPVRKPGKLPGETRRYEYSLEYGTDTLEIHRDAIQPGQRVLIVDDLLATGGTVKAAAHLVEESGGCVVGMGFLVELAELNGRKALEGHRIVSLIKE